MSVVTKGTTTPKPVTTGLAKPVAMKSAVVETRVTPVQDLMTYIGGGQIIFDYYQQVLMSNDHPRALDIQVAAPQQQYNLIKRLEARQQGDRSSSYDDATAEWTSSMEVILFPGLSPNVGDMAKVDIGQGEWALFHVTAVEPKSIYHQTCYSITLTLLYRNDGRALTNITAKVVETYYFVTDFLRAGKNPMIVDEQHEQYRSLDSLFNAMIMDYVRSFYSDVNKTLIIPGQVGGAYDPFLTKAFLALLSVTDHPLLGEMTRHALDISYAYNTKTVWDALLAVEASYLYLCTRRVGLVTKNVIRDRGENGGAYLARFQQIMYPADERLDADRQFVTAPTAGPVVLQNAGAALTDIERLIPNNVDTVNMPFDDEPSVAVAREIPQVNDDLYYVFPKAFYDRDEAKMSRLEKLVWRTLDHSEINITELYEMVDMSRRWDRLERFYYVPVLIWLCTLAFRGPSHA